MREWSECLLILGGLLHFGFAVFHLMFWRIFHWKTDLASLTRTNRGIMQVLNLCITFLFLLIGYVSLVHRQDLLNTGMGRTILSGMGLFWVARAIAQLMFFKMKNWISLSLMAVFIFCSVIYLLPVLIRPM